MIIIRKNRDVKSMVAYDVYLRLDDGSEHEIPGVIMVKQFPDKLPTGPHFNHMIEMHVDDRAVRFE